MNMLQSVDGGFALALVALGGALGASARFIVLGRMFALRQALGEFPIGVMMANVVGSFLTGILLAWILYIQLHGAQTDDFTSSAVFVFFATGFFGGFTTFSSFALDVLILADKRSFRVLSLYIALSVILSIGALMVGLWATRSIFIG